MNGTLNVCGSNPRFKREGDLQMKNVARLYRDPWGEGAGRGWYSNIHVPSSLLWAKWGITHFLLLTNGVFCGLIGACVDSSVL